MACHSQSSCLLCCGKLIDNSFTAQNAKSLSRILRLGISAGLGLESDSDLISTSSSASDSQFSLWFQSATYCPDCVRTVQDLENILRNLDDLDAKLREGRSKIEEKFKSSAFVQGNHEEGSNYNEILRVRIVARLDQNKERLTWISKKLVEWAEDDEAQTFAKNEATDSQMPETITADNLGEEYQSDEDANPPSPTHSFASNASFEEKFVPSSSPLPLQISMLDETETHVQRDPNFPNEVESSLLTKTRLRERKPVLYGAEESTLENESVELPVVLLKKMTPTDVNSVKLRCQTRIAELKRKYQNVNQEKFSATLPKKRFNLPTKPAAAPQQPRIHCPVENCSVVFLASQNCHLQAHIKRAHEGLQNCYECETCKQSFPNYKQFQAHETTHSTVVASNTCNHCQQVFPNYDQLIIHIRNVHFPRLAKSTDGPPPEVIDRDQEQRQKRLKNMDPKTIAMLQAKKKVYLCEICSKSFKTKTYLKYHQSKYHAEISTYGPIKCKECGRVFSTPASLRGHTMKVHRGEFKIKCPHCDYGALTPSGLGIHMTNKHSDERKFMCSQCPSTYKQKSALNVHMRTHTGERPYKCKTCDKAFIDSGGLSRHELIHSGAQSHVCEICGKSFPLHNYLYVHMKSHNKDGSRPKQIRNKNETKTPNSTAQVSHNPQVISHPFPGSSSGIFPTSFGNSATVSTTTSHPSSSTGFSWDHDQIVFHNL